MKTAKFEICATLKIIEAVQDFNFIDPKGLFKIYWIGSNVMCFDYDGDDEEAAEAAQDFICDIRETLDDIIGADEYGFSETETKCDY